MITDVFLRVFSGVGYTAYVYNMPIDHKCFIVNASLDVLESILYVINSDKTSVSHCNNMKLCTITKILMSCRCHRISTPNTGTEPSIPSWWRGWSTPCLHVVLVDENVIRRATTQISSTSSKVESSTFRAPWRRQWRRRWRNDRSRHIWGALNSVLTNGSSCFGAGLTCLCTGKWKLAVLCGFGCGFDLHMYWPMGARGSVRVWPVCVLANGSARLRACFRGEKSRVESREKVRGEDGENGGFAAVARLRVGERTVIKKWRGYLHCY